MTALSKRFSGVPRCRLCGHAHTTHRWTVDGYEIHQCRSCRVLFVTNEVRPEEIAALYGARFQARRGEHSDESEAGSPDAINARARVRRIRTNTPGGRLLDVGCATGEFLLAAKPYFHVHGVEVNGEAAAVARSRGLSVTVASRLAELVGRVEPFDVITLWDVIEHVPDPGATLTAAAEPLEPGGHLALTTGDASSAIARYSGRYWHLLTPPFHLFFFAPRSIRWALTQAGLTDARITHTGKRVPLGFAAFKLSERVPSLPTRMAHAAVSRLPARHWAVPINLFDIMAVSTIKPDSDRRRDAQRSVHRRRVHASRAD